MEQLADTEPGSQVAVPEIPAGSSVGVTATQRGLIIAFKGNQYFCSWRKIKTWTKPERDLFITFEIYSIPTNTYSFLQLETPQAPYLMSAVIEMIKILQREIETETFKTSDLIVDHDGTVLAWNNAVFSKTQFTAEIEQGSLYTDLSTIPKEINASGDAEVQSDANGNCPT